MRRRAIAAAALAILTAGCGSSGGGGTSAGGAPGGGGGGGGGTATGSPPRLVTIGFAANGRTMTVHPYDTIRIKLQSTYWRFHPVTGGVLSHGRIAAHPAHGPVVIRGMGSGTMIATFRVLKPGTAHITAARQSCGEAMRCVGGEGSFAVTVVAH